MPYVLIPKPEKRMKYAAIEFIYVKVPRPEGPNAVDVICSVTIGATMLTN